MPKIFVLTGPDVGTERDVDSGATFGRDEMCEVRLKDASVSRKHCRIERGPQGYEVVDLESRNGIYVKGARVQRAPLAHGEEFTVGSVRVRFVDPPAGAIDEIELAPAEPAAEPAPVPAAKAAEPARATPEIGAARRRAMAGKEGVLLFHRIEDKPDSILHDEMGQQNPLLRAALWIFVIALAGGLFYGAWKLSAGSPQAAPADEAAEEGR